MSNNKNVGIHKVGSVIGIILCVIFGFMLICNLTIIIKGSLKPDTPPSVLGTTPMVVLTGSMSGNAPDHIEPGDLIFVGKADVNALKVGDIISFQEEGAVTVTTHRIIEIVNDNGTLSFKTKGDANNIEDQDLVSADRVVGIYKFRIAGLGNFALFLQKPEGMLIFIGVPIIAFVIYDIVRRQRYAKKEKATADEMQEELERLRKLAGEKENEKTDKE